MLANNSTGANKMKRIISQKIKTSMEAYDPGDHVVSGRPHTPAAIIHEWASFHPSITKLVNEYRQLKIQIPYEDDPEKKASMERRVDEIYNGIEDVFWPLYDRWQKSKEDIEEDRDDPRDHEDIDESSPKIWEQDQMAWGKGTHFD